MNPYYPRYVEDVKSPPMLSTGRRREVKMIVRPVRNWVCTECGRKGEVVWMEKWNFPTVRHCPECKSRTKHEIK